MAARVYDSRAAAERRARSLNPSAATVRIVKVDRDQSPTGEPGWVIEIESWATGTSLWAQEKHGLGPYMGDDEQKGAAR